MILYILQGTDYDIRQKAQSLTDSGEYVIDYGSRESVLNVRDEIIYRNHTKIYAFYIGESQNWVRFLKIMIMNYLDERFSVSLSVMGKDSGVQYPEEIDIKMLKV